MMAAFSGEKRFLDLKRNVLNNIEDREEGVKMDGFFDILENMAREDGIKQGISQGISRGISQGKQEIISKLLNKGKSPEQINELIEEPLEYIYQVREQMPQTGEISQTVGQDMVYGTDGD